MSKQDKKQWARPILNILIRDYSQNNANNVLKSCKGGSGTISITVDYGQCVYGYSMLCETCDKVSAS
ncbi:MAG: hypothetical protein PHN59_04620 [Candidatus Omnitrophica bacterium]|nr:hypothetical protein [Candidatus Omnitrophota bacterium]